MATAPSTVRSVAFAMCDVFRATVVLLLQRPSATMILRAITTAGGVASIKYGATEDSLPLILGLNDNQLHDTQGRLRVCFPVEAEEELRKLIPMLSSLRNLDTIILGTTQFRATRTWGIPRSASEALMSFPPKRA